MILKAKFSALLSVFVVVLGLLVPSCSSDHDHYQTYGLDGNYYYNDGYLYYTHADVSYRYDHDTNHYYYGRLEWKGASFGWGIVLRENPYYGLILRVDPICNPVLYNNLGDPHDHEVMVRFAFKGSTVIGSGTYPLVDVIHIYYTGR